MGTAVKPGQNDFKDREFPMTDGDFRLICSIAYKLTGIALSDHKRNMVYGRLVRRLRALKIPRFSDYCELINKENNAETTHFINAITTNLTSFFREGHHFEHLKKEVMPSLIKTCASNRRIRIWSAGCSTGEEPYSIAMVVKSIPKINDWDVKILATDLDTNVVNKAKLGVYSAERADGIPDDYRRFLQVDKNHQQVKVKSSVSDLITFKPLNLLHTWPMKGPFDVIFCRNVVIYFDLETQKKLFQRYADLLKDDGHLYIGHSENLHNVTNRFQSIGRTIYRRCI